MKEELKRKKTLTWIKHAALISWLLMLGTCGLGGYFVATNPFHPENQPVGYFFLVSSIVVILGTVGLIRWGSGRERKSQ